MEREEKEGVVEVVVTKGTSESVAVSIVLFTLMPSLTKHKRSPPCDEERSDEQGG